MNDALRTEFAGVLGGIGYVIADTAGKWTLAEEVTAGFVYLRLHGSRVLYGSDYTDEELSAWAPRVGRWSSEGRDVYVYFDNDQKAYAPHDALELARQVRARPRSPGPRAGPSVLRWRAGRPARRGARDRIPRSRSRRRRAWRSRSPPSAARPDHAAAGRRRAPQPRWPTSRRMRGGRYQTSAPPSASRPGTSARAAPPFLKVRRSDAFVPRIPASRPDTSGS